MSETPEQTVEIPIEPTEGERVERLVHLPHIPAKGCQHYFVRQSGTEVKCRNCGMGLFVNPTDEIIEGVLKHVY
jgi:hypothetical protein